MSQSSNTASVAVAESAALHCSQCGSLNEFDPASGGLRCDHCQALAPVPPPASPGPRELSLAEGLRSAPRGFGSVATVVSCGSCGAEVHLAAEERATRCTYCASPTVVAKPARADLLQPESIVPFQVPQPRATVSFDAWLKGLWFRPRDLHRMSRVEGVHGIYLPYWTFDAQLSSEWTAERGTHYYETEHYTETNEHGRTERKSRQVQHTRWSDARGHRTDRENDHLVCASKGVSRELADELCEFDTQKLVAYSPAYLYGWRAEAYAVDLPAAWARAQDELRAIQEGRCGEDVGGDTHRGLEVTTRFGRETFKHILLPLFVMAYRYKGKPYQVLVNGQTAEVVGKAPYSWLKLLLVALVVMGLSILVPFLLLLTIPGLLYALYWTYQHRDELA